MPNKKAFITHFSTRERLCECCGAILCHMHVYSVMGTRCTVYASTKDQSNGTLRINIQGQNLHTKDQPYGLMGTQWYVQKNNPIRARGTCEYKGPTHGDCMHK